MTTRTSLDDSVLQRRRGNDTMIARNVSSSSGLAPVHEKPVIASVASPLLRFTYRRYAATWGTLSMQIAFLEWIAWRVSGYEPSKRLPQSRRRSSLARKSHLQSRCLRGSKEKLKLSNGSMYRAAAVRIMLWKDEHFQKRKGAKREHYLNTPPSVSCEGFILLREVRWMRYFRFTLDATRLFACSLHCAALDEDLSEFDMGGMCSWILRMNQWWEAVQVELHGQYSVTRLKALRQYGERTILLRAIVIAVLIPVPCLALIVATDALPLASPYAGLGQQTFGFWFRTIVLCWLVTFMSITVVCRVIPELPMSTRRLWCISLLIPVLVILAGCGFIRVIGFPAPFAIQMDMGPWVATLAIALWFSWKDILRDNTKVRDDFLRYLKVFQGQFVIILVYTAFNVTFTLVGHSYQTAFSLLLPAIKIVFKNWISSGLGQLKDLAPTIIVFSVDVFHSLYVSLMMQQSVTLGSMVVVMGVDIAQSLIVYYEIHKVLMRVQASAANLPRVGVRDTGNPDVANIDIFRLAADILEENEYLREHPNITSTRHIAGVWRQSSARKSWTGQKDRRSQGMPRGSGNSTRVVPSPLEQPEQAIESSLKTAQVVPSPHDQPNQSIGSARAVLSMSNVAVLPLTLTESPTDTKTLQLECVQNVLKLLHMTEFYVFIEFGEVMMATLYAVYLAILSDLPNRVYYTQFSRLSDDEMRVASSRVLMYAFLEFVSYVVLCVAFKRKLRNFSPTRQLAFALQSHWQIVLAMFTVWTFLTIQCAIQHYGADYTFQFKWLHTTPSQ